MLFEQLKDKVAYRFFDKTFPASHHYYSHKDLDSPSCPIEIVQENCKNATKAMGGNGLAVLRQVHGKAVHVATSPTEYGLEPEADGLVTNVPGLILGIQTADCVPVLFACKSGKVIGSAHCGWKSAKMDLTKEVLRLMRELGAEEVVAMIGPSIKQSFYEVSQDYRDDFVADDSSSTVFFKEGKPSHYFFDLPGYVERKLNLAGIAEVSIHPDDTYSMEDQYYSWRRCCHKGVAYEGNLLSSVMINIYS